MRHAGQAGRQAGRAARHSSSRQAPEQTAYSDACRTRRGLAEGSTHLMVGAGRATDTPGSRRQKVQLVLYVRVRTHSVRMSACTKQLCVLHLASSADPSSSQRPDTWKQLDKYEQADWLAGGADEETW